jgi:hypothetical protein
LRQHCSGRSGAPAVAREGSPELARGDCCADHFRTPPAFLR